MNWILGAFVVAMVPIHVWASEPPSHMESPACPGPAILKLTSSVDRLAGLLEKDMAFRAEEREARRVEVAVTVIGLRYRKIDRLETEIQQISREEDESAPSISRMKAGVDQLGKQGRAESGALTEEAKAAIAEVELQIRFEEERIARLRERKIVLQNEVSAEQRRLASVEAILDAWMEKQ
jgi:hypothetical protein